MLVNTIKQVFSWKSNQQGNRIGKAPNNPVWKRSLFVLPRYGVFPTHPARVTVANRTQQGDQPATSPMVFIVLSSGIN